MDRPPALLSEIHAVGRKRAFFFGRRANRAPALRYCHVILPTGSPFPRHALSRWLLVIAGIAPATAAWGDTTHEFWPELQVFWRLDPGTQLLFNPAPTHSRDSDERTAIDWGLYIDYRAPKDPASYRIGYVYSVSDPDDERARKVEHRIVLDYNYRWKVGASGLLIDRTRVDLRNVEGSTSQRLRNRLQYEYEVRLGENGVVPYANLELSYDTRYSGLSRSRLELGATWVFSPTADLTPYLAWQTDFKPARSNINALGLLLAFHF